VDTLPAAGAEDKPLLGSKRSADSGAKTRLGLGESWASANLIHWDWHPCEKSQGPGDGVPRETISFFIDSLRPFRSF